MRKGSSVARCGRAGGGDDQMRCVPKDLLRAAEARLLLLAAMGMLTLLAACGQENRFVAPPPPKVTVQLPLMLELDLVGLRLDHEQPRRERARWSTPSRC